MEAVHSSKIHRHAILHTLRSISYPITLVGLLFLSHVCMLVATADDSNKTGNMQQYNAHV
jgi:hypothetical protein